MENWILVIIYIYFFQIYLLDDFYNDSVSCSYIFSIVQ